MSGLGWITESTILPSKPHQIEEVGQASLVDLKAALYASEERAKAIQRDPAARATEEQRRRELRAADPLGAKNRELPRFRYLLHSRTSKVLLLYARHRDLAPHEKTPHEPVYSWRSHNPTAPRRVPARRKISPPLRGSGEGWLSAP